MAPKKPVTIICGMLVKELRLEACLTQQQLATKIDSDRSYISLIESGGRRITLGSLARIGAGLGISISDLLRALANRLK